MGSTVARLFILLSTFTAIACSSGQCRRDGSPIVNKEEAKTLTEQKFANEVVAIAKSDGSLQCGYKIGTTLDDMAQQLEGIEIISTEKKHDGLMRVQSCGAPTGMLNVYHIHRKNVRLAVQKGFKVIDQQ